MKVRALQTVKSNGIPFMGGTPRTYLIAGKEYDVLDITYLKEHDDKFYTILGEDGFASEYAMNMFEIVWDDEQLNTIVNHICKDLITIGYRNGYILGREYSISYIGDEVVLIIKRIAKENTYYSKISCRIGQISHDMIKHMLVSGLQQNAFVKGE